MNDLRTQTVKVQLLRIAKIRKTRKVRKLLEPTLKIKWIPDVWRRSYVILGAKRTNVMLMRCYGTERTKRDNIRGVKQSTDELRKELGLDY